eukprot:6457257-Amphidinium_carterae.1
MEAGLCTNCLDFRSHPKLVVQPHQMKCTVVVPCPTDLLTQRNQCMLHVWLVDARAAAIHDVYGVAITTDPLAAGGGCERSVLAARPGG